MSARFGDGWASRNAADLIIVLVTFGNVTIDRLLKAIPVRERSKINVRSVENAMMRLREAK